MGQNIDSSETTREALNFNFSEYFNLVSLKSQDARAAWR
jgi:hypothetical protein